MDQLYDFGSKLLSSTVQAHAKGLNRGADHDELSDHLKLILGDYGNIVFPVSFHQEYGKNMTDILDTGYSSLYLISDKMVRTMQEHKLEGWKTFDCKLFDKKGNEVHGYHGLSITGRCGEIDYSKSEIIKKQLVAGGSITDYYKGKYINPETFDKGDFFLPKNNYGPIINTRAMKALSGARLSNIRFKALSEIETPEFGLPSKWRKKNLL